MARPRAFEGFLMNEFKFERTWTIVRWVAGGSADHAPLTRID